MQCLLVLLLMCCGIQISTQQFQVSPSIYTPRSCYINQDLITEYRSSNYHFILPLYKSLAVRSNLNFVFSPTSIWIILAAIAEGADPLTQQKLFQLLRLPNDQCLRQGFYQLATTRAYPSNDVNIKSTRILLLDDGVTVNPTWYDLVTRNSLLEVVKAPIRYNPIATANEIKRIMSSHLPRLNLSGNSVLLDTMDYNGLWSTAFADAVIERAPFYNLQGETIGAVDLMRVQRRARMTYDDRLKAKIIELPVGSDQRYRMLFAIIIGNNDLPSLVGAVNGDLVFEIIGNLRPSLVPIDVAIPRMVVSSEIDLRVILEDFAVKELWTDPAVTRYISNPPALPSSFMQRATLVLNNTGLEYPHPEPGSAYSTRTGLDPILGRDFIADRPFLFAVAARSVQLNFVYSPLSVWLILAGMAEGTDSFTRQKIFNLLNVPYDDCTRQKYYQLATSHIVQADDIKVISNRILLLDAGVTPNPTWYDVVMKNNLLDVLHAPIRHNAAVTAKEIKRLMNAELPKINFNGNSVILDTVDFNALWTTEFADAKIERSPFHDQLGNPIGFVDLMKTTKRARLGYVKNLKAKVLELPIGANERYRVVFGMFPGSKDVRASFGIATKDIIFEMFASFRESYVPVEVAIPRLVITSELDVRTLIEDLGVTSLWNDPAATRNVSYPPALPSSFVHRATLTLDNHGVQSSPPEEPPSDLPTGLDPKVGNDFIADRPFLYGLFDAETLTCIMASAFSVPTYQN
ncbi:hypothetical protein PYW08_010986 [Mythimna loreyi]|uniref:Uncharacterized protein n=1 Tax=Mythimna loreyi TaxID=667449 RepID=A0ACC2Q204_9NEOP|nr:hypothetical protein PYW08_010986 [Mythimna loreyi]